jgi:hypothetical protein
MLLFVSKIFRVQVVVVLTFIFKFELKVLIMVVKKLDSTLFGVCIYNRPLFTVDSILCVVPDFNGMHFRFLFKIYQKTF